MYPPYFQLLGSLGVPYVALKDKAWGGDDKRYPPSRFFTLGAEIEQYLDQNGLSKNRQALIAELGTGKRRIAKALGQKVLVERIPSIFRDVLEVACQLATGTPVVPLP